VLSCSRCPPVDMAPLSALPLALLLVALLAQQAAGARTGHAGRHRCPPKGFDALPSSEFNITEYIAAPWYAQRQVSGQIRAQAGECRSRGWRWRCCPGALNTSQGLPVLCRSL
jgi:hypothetical protein